MNMNVVPGRCCRGTIDSFGLLTCISVIMLQSAIFSRYFAVYFHNNLYYLTMIPDILVIVFIIFTTITQMKRNQTNMKENYARDGLVKHAFLCWLFYSILLALKVFITFCHFHRELVPLPLENYEKIFDDNLYKLTIGLSIFVYAFLIEANHYTSLSSRRQLVIENQFMARSLDIIDTILIIDLLFEAEKNGWRLHWIVEYFILSYACFNLCLPAFTLIPLRFSKISEKFCCGNKVWGLVYSAVVNVPYLAIRCYIFYHLKMQRKGEKYDLSIFVFKNLIMLYIALRNVWNGLQYWREKRIYSTIEMHKPAEIVAIARPESEDENDSFNS